MSRYTYNSNLVAQALEKLGSAYDSLAQTNVDMKKGIDTICNARGAENMQVDFSVITGYRSQVIDYIDEMSNTIREKTQEIEEYESAPWWKKLFSTIGMGVLKVVEGFVGLNENVVDGFAAIVGWVGGLFSSDFKDSVGEFIKKDWVGDTTAQWYEEGWLKDINKYSYMSHQSTAANVLKGIGTAAGYVALSCIPYVGPIIAGVAATAGGIGSGTQAGLQAGNTFDQAFGEGLKQGAVAAATSIIAGGVASKLGSLAKAASAVDDVGAAVISSGDDILRIGAGAVDDIANASDDVLRIGAGAVDDIANASDDVLRIGANSVDEAVGAVDDVAKVGDESLEVIGKHTSKNGQEFLKVKTSSGKEDLIDIATGKSGTQGVKYSKEALKSIGIGDDVVNGTANSIDDGVNAVTKAASNVDETVNATSKVASGADETASAASKTTKTNVIKDKINNIKQSVDTKIATTLDKHPTIAKAVNKVGTAINNHPTATKAVVGGLAGVSNGSIADNIQSSTYNMSSNAESSISQQSTTGSTNSTTVPSNNITEAVSSTVSNTSNGTANTPVASSSGGTNVSTGQNISSAARTSSSPTVIETISAKELSNTNSSTGTGNNASAYQTSNNTQSSTTTPSSNTQTTDSIVGSANNGASSGGGNFSPTVSRLTGNSSISGETVTTASKVADSFGDISSSLSKLTESNKVNVPTSSSPILSSNGAKSQSTMMPLGAGLGAAAIAGFGTKAYMDKREKSKDETASIDTEDWQGDSNSVNIDYGKIERTEEADYLSPTDEYAFQE